MHFHNAAQKNEKNADNMSKLRSQLNMLANGTNGVETENRPNIGQNPPASAPAVNVTARESVVKSKPLGQNGRNELTEIKNALHHLSQKLEASAKQASQQPPQQPPMAQPKCNAQDIDTNAIAGSINESIRDNLRDQMAIEIDKMRGELGTIQENASKASDRAVLDDIQRISQGIKELQSRKAVSADQFGEMAGDLRGIHQDIRTLSERPQPQLDAREISQSIQASYDEIAKRLDTLGSSQTADQITLLSEKLETIKGSISATDPTTLARIEEHLQALGGGISALAQNDGQNGSMESSNALNEVLPEYFDSLDKRMDEISRAIVASANPEPSTRDDSAFDRIEARITALGKSVESISVQNVPPVATEMQIPEQLLHTLSKLEERISHLSLTAQADKDAGSQAFEQQFAALTQKIDELEIASAQAGEAQSIDPEMAAKLDNLSLTLERAINSGDGSVNQLEEQITKLYQRVEQIGSTQTDNAPYEAQLSALEGQMGSISSQLESISGQPDLSAIENRLGGIEEQFAAGLKNSGATDDGQSQKIISDLATDLKELTKSSSELKGHSLETFDAVRDSLSLILERVNKIESRIAEDNSAANFAQTNAQSQSDSTETSSGERMEAHNSDMVNAAREYASNLTAQNVPEVDAPALGMENLPQMREHAPLAGSISGDEQLLEPGSGAPSLAGNGPDMEALMRDAKQNKRSETLEDQQQNPTDFITAARKAAQAAANEENTGKKVVKKKSKPAKATKKPSKGTLGKINKPLMLGAAALALAVVAFPVAKYFSAPSKVQISKIEKVTPKIAMSKTDAPKSIVPTDTKNSDAVIKSDEPRQLSSLENDSVADGADITQLGDAAKNNTASRSLGSEPKQIVSLAPVSMPPETVGPIALRQAAANGEPKALFEVGRRYATGIDGSPDLKEAVKWYQHSANAKYAPAQYGLGNFYEKGHGVASDPKMAASWYKKAADQGNALAMHNLAVINAMGVLEGGADMKTASSWFKKAADYGVKDSQVNLGIVYAKALGVEADLGQAYKWFAIAAKAGDKDASAKRDTVAKQLRPDQLEVARGEVELWRPKALDKNVNSVEIPPEWTTVANVTASLTSAQMIQKTQDILTKLGFEPGPADGMMGKRTVNAIKLFQSRAGIAVTGKVSPNLLNALENAQG